MEEKMTTCSYIYVAEFQFKSVEMEALLRKGSVSYGLGAEFPSLTVLSGTRYRTELRQPSPVGISDLRAEISWGIVMVQRSGKVSRGTAISCFFFLFCFVILGNDTGKNPSAPIRSRT